jgi:hypothetical protein
MRNAEFHILDESIPMPEAVRPSIGWCLTRRLFGEFTVDVLLQHDGVVVLAVLRGVNQCYRAALL